jgi:hypothetical protein
MQPLLLATATLASCLCKATSKGSFAFELQAKVAHRAKGSRQQAAGSRGIDTSTQQPAAAEGKRQRQKEQRLNSFCLSF